MLRDFLRRLFTNKDQRHSKNVPENIVDRSNLTGADFEFLITPSDIEIKSEDFDRIMTPESFGWLKADKNNWNYYQVGSDEFSYSWEIPGIQMTFNNEIKYVKAKQIADEVVAKLSKYTSQKVELVFIPKDRVISFQQINNSIATFKIKYAFQITGRPFFVLGEILSGTIKIGMTADLKSTGVNKELVIEAIEFALHREEEKVWEDVGLGFSDLNDMEKEILKTQAPFDDPIVIKGKNIS